MTRTHAITTALLSVIAAALFGGCQKTMGTAANGPFAPAGTLAPATSQPLTPIWPLSGATRVPPPPTGSTQASNHYSSPTAMSGGDPLGNPAAYDSFASSSGQTAPGNVPFNHPPATPPSLSANASNNLGGMPVIDLTAGMNAPRKMPIQYSNQAVGSGIASNQPPNNGWQSNGAQTGAFQPTPSISVPPIDLASRLRPLDANLSAVAIPSPDQGGFQPTYGQMQAGGYVPAQNQSTVAMTQYRDEAYEPSPAWQSVQPASATAMTQNPQYVPQLSTGPSTEPVNQTQADSLLWRNPAVAR